MKHLSDKALEKLRSASDEPDLEGTRYRLLEHVARGGMGVVYAAEDEALQRRVALKVLDMTAADAGLTQRLMREARVLARLEHPGIVPVHDVGTLVDGRVFYTMKFVEGRRLDKHIANIESVQDRLRLFLRICDAVGFAHARGVLHRDLKPTNVMVGPFGEVLVMDWGLAKVFADVTKDDATEIAVPNGSGTKNGNDGETAITLTTEHGTVMGTPGYMSPEQARGDVAHLDRRSDVYSLGALLRFVAEKEVMRGDHLQQPRVDKSVAAICDKAMAEKPEDRYSSVPELGMDVSRFLDGLAVTARPESFLEKVARFYRRYRFFILLMAAYLAMRVALLLFMRK